MGTSHSTSDKSNRKPKKKPHKDFPLSWHQAGYWCKKIRGKIHYFGDRWAEPNDALIEFLRAKDDLLAGREPRPKTEGLTVREAMNAFLTDRQHRLDVGELARRSFDDYKASCKRVIRTFGGERVVADLGPEDFLKLRSQMAKNWGPTTLGNEVQRVRVVFNYLWQADLIDAPVKFGPSFRKPSKRVIRVARAEKGKRLFEPKQIRDLLEITKAQMNAMILLGINCGFGNNDCGTLPIDAIDLDRGWINYARPKTGIMRRCFLWNETVVALRLVLNERNEPRDGEDKPFLFITKYGKRWFKQTRDNPIANEFRKLVDELGIYRPGLTFYALRHTFETVAGESRDQVAVDAVMGHARDDMASVYREEISDDRLIAVAERVRSWLYDEETKKTET